MMRVCPCPIFYFQFEFKIKCLKQCDRRVEALGIKLWVFHFSRGGHHYQELTTGKTSYMDINKYEMITMYRLHFITSVACLMPLNSFTCLCAVSEQEMCGYWILCFPCVVNSRGKFSPGPGFKAGSPALRARCASNCATHTNQWAKSEPGPKSDPSENFSLKLTKQDLPDGWYEKPNFH